MHTFSRKSQAFTLIELLIVIAIIAVLAVVVVVILNPAELLKQSRDSSRLSDMDTLNKAVQIYSFDPGGSLGAASTTYVSIADPAATSTAGDQCQGLGLSTSSIPSGWSYHCAASSTYRNVDGNGWIPLNFRNISSGSPIGSLPVDPTNTRSSGLYYTYTPGGSFELTAIMESSKYGLGGSADKVSTDGGYNPAVYEVGTSLTLNPYSRNLLTYSGLSGFVGDFEGSDDGFTAYNGGTAVTFGWTNSYGSVTGADAQYVQAASTANCCNYGGIQADIVPALKVGQEYTVSFYAKSIANAGTLSTHFVDTSGSLSGMCLNFEFTPTANWEPYTKTCILNEANNPTWFIYSNTPSQAWAIDDLQVVAD